MPLSLSYFVRLYYQKLLRVEKLWIPVNFVVGLVWIFIWDGYYILSRYVISSQDWLRVQKSFFLHLHPKMASKHDNKLRVSGMSLRDPISLTLLFIVYSFPQLQNQLDLQKWEWGNISHWDNRMSTPPVGTTNNYLPSIHCRKSHFLWDTFLADIWSLYQLCPNIKKCVPQWDL